MLQPPPISSDVIVDCLRAEYGLRTAALEFLPLGADFRTAVYRAPASGGDAYFVKLRLGPFDEMAALLPRWLAEQGVGEVMAPLPALSGRPWAACDDFTLLLYPFVDGRDGYDAALSDEQWALFGRAMRGVHDAVLPAALTGRIAVEMYDPRWRAQLRDFMAAIERTEYADVVARQFGAFLRERRAQVLDLVDRTERFAQRLAAAGSPFVLCHTDLHAGNLLLADDGRLFIVDWDAPLLAPRERDLMYPGGGQGFLGRTAEQEEALFFQGYGAVQVDLAALAYYRLERIVEDLAVFCDQLLDRGYEGSPAAASDRQQALRWATANFLPGNVLGIAHRTAERAAARER